MFLLINMAIIPFTITPSIDVLHQFFLSSVMTSMLLGIVLISNNIFDEDAMDGSLDQYQVFGVPIYIIYLSKVVSLSFEFILIISAAFACAAIFYTIEPALMIKIWLVSVLAVPLLMSISIFGAMLTINLKKTAAIAIFLVFPLLISALIMLSLAINKILITGDIIAARAYVEISFGVTILLVPVLSILVKYLR